MILYHASQVKNLRIIKPKRTLSNDKYIGDFVFATRNKKMALMYMIPKGFATLMNPESSIPSVVICGNSETLHKKDSGGSIYVLPDTQFNTTPQKDLSDYEMVSTKPVIPVEEIIYPNVINALVKEGISVYFTDHKTFSKLILSPDQESMIKLMTKY